MKEKELRRAIIAQCRAMNALGLNQGMAGNISARLDDAMLITPSAIPYDFMQPEMLAKMPVEGEYGAWSGRCAPSTEWRFHLDILRARSDVGAIVHCHATYATVLSMLRKPIEAAHYMIALFGGPSVRCTSYAPYGTKELADLAVAGIEGRNAVLLGNHGMIAVGATLAEAMWRASELETLAKMYYLALAAGRPFILSDDEIMHTVERFKGYGRGPDTQAATPAPLKKGRANNAPAAKGKSAPGKKPPKTAGARRR
jgi:L-fuculose-phosphate aldolase